MLGRGAELSAAAPDTGALAAPSASVGDPSRERADGEDGPAADAGVGVLGDGASAEDELDGDIALSERPSTLEKASPDVCGDSASRARRWIPVRDGVSRPGSPESADDDDEAVLAGEGEPCEGPLLISGRSVPLDCSRFDPRSASAETSSEVGSEGVGCPVGTGAVACPGESDSRARRWTPGGVGSVFTDGAGNSRGACASSGLGVLMRVMGGAGGAESSSSGGWCTRPRGFRRMIADGSAPSSKRGAGVGDEAGSGSGRGISFSTGLGGAATGGVGRRRTTGVEVARLGNVDDGSSVIAESGSAGGSSLSVAC